MHYDTQTLELPMGLEGWRWERRPIPNGDLSRLVSPDGWKTKEYGAYPERAIQEAQRYVTSQPKPKTRPVIDVIVGDDTTNIQPASESDDFSYQALDAETRSTVQQLSREIGDSLNEIEQIGCKVGERLITVKEKLPRGSWRSWLRSEIPQISVDTAENLILRAKLERRMPKLSALVEQEYIAPTAITRLARPSVPDDAVNEVIAYAERGEYVPVAKAEQIIRDAKERKKVQEAQGHSPPRPAQTPPPSDAHVALLRANQVLHSMLSSLSDHQIALIAAATWDHPGVRWYEVTRNELEHHIRIVWQFGLERSVQQGGVDVVKNLAMQGLKL